jgi:RHS repeat-associated protein
MPGLPPYTSIHGSNIDAVNLTSGALHIEIPIAEVTERGTTSTWKFVYDTPVFSSLFISGNSNSDPQKGTWVIEGPLNLDPSTNWRLSTPTAWSLTHDNVQQDKEGQTLTCQLGTYAPYGEPRYVNYQIFQNYRLVDPQGTPHPVDLYQTLITTEDVSPNSDGINPPCNLANTTSSASLDNTGIYVDTVAGTIRTRDGSVFTTLITNPNGNQTTTTNDMLGRPVVTTTTSNGIETIAVHDSNGNAQQYQVTYTTVPVGTSDCSHIYVFPDQTCKDLPLGSIKWSMPSQITLPNGTAYSFQYNLTGHGELTSMQLPTGATISYVYGQMLYDESGNSLRAGDFQGHMAVSSRTITDPTGSYTWQYTSPGAVGFGLSVTDPLGNCETHNASNVYVGNYVSTSRVETSVNLYNGACTGTPLETTTTAYTADLGTINQKVAVVNIRPVTVTTTLNNTLSSQLTTAYETTCATGPCTLYNPTSVAEYDFGATTPTRTTTYTYLHDIGSASVPAATYAALNIVDKPILVSVYTGSNTTTPVSQTKYEYDNYTAGITSTNNAASQHSSSFNSTYLSRGNVTAISKWLNTTNSWLTTRYQYDDLGNRLSSTDPAQHTTTFSYADAWSETSCVSSLGSALAYPTTVTDPLGHLTKTAFSSCTGAVGSVRDANDLAANNAGTVYSYDMMNRITSISYPDTGSVLTQYSDSIPNSVKSTTAIKGTTQKILSVLLDYYGRPRKTTLLSDPDGPTYTRVAYDALGRVVQQWNPTRCDPDLNQTSCTGETTFGITTNYFDGMSRNCLVVPPDGALPSGNSCPSAQPANTIFTTYSTNATTVTDQAGKSRKSVTDGLGRLSTVFEDPSGYNYETDYTYDALNNLLTVNQKGGSTNSANWRTRTFTYDSLSRLVCASNPETSTAACPATASTNLTPGTTGYSYDLDGNLLQKTSPAPNQTGSSTVTLSYCYDALNRVTGKAYTAQTCSNGLLPTPLVSYTYDQSACLGLSACYNVGHRTGMTDQAGSESWAYDTMGRIWADQRTTNSLSKTFTYSYNLDGSTAMLGYPTGPNNTNPEVVAYQPGGAGRPLSLTTNGAGFVGDAHYAPSGAMCNLQDDWDGEWTAVNTYNSRLQPATYQVQQQFSGTLPTSCTAITTTANVMDFKYNFIDSSSHNNGNVQSITNNIDWHRSQSFVYDSLNRISTAQTNADNQPAYQGDTNSIKLCWAETYTYDAWGNLLSLGLNSATQPNYVGCTQESGFNYTNSMGANNRLTATGFTYDAAGNMIASPGPSTYVYDAENHLTSTATPSGSATYTYDGDGKRVMKSTGTLYWYGASSDALLETDLSNNLKFQYFYFGGQRVGRENNSNQVQWYFGDHLGSSRVVFSLNGDDDSDFYPFGGERVISSGAGNQYKFTAKERDSESGLDNFGARYDSSSMGRFMTADPGNIGVNRLNPQSWNAYSYSLNNPLSLTDPTGLYVCEDSEKCDSANDQAFAKSLADAQNAANKLTGDDQAAAQRAIDAYGAQGVDNGVNVRFDSNVTDGVTEVSGIANGENDKENDNPNKQNINVTFNPNAVGDASLVAHEGSHVADGSAWVASGFSSNLNPTNLTTELNAYHVQFNILNSLSAINAPPGMVPNGGFLNFKNGQLSWHAEDTFKGITPELQKKIEQNYQNTALPAFQKGSVVPR